jgi:hypothetical protein
MFHSLQTLFRSRTKARKAAPPAPRTSLNLECLEARITPSSFSHHSSTSVDVTVIFGNNNHTTIIGNHTHDVVLNGNIIILEGGGGGGEAG